MGYSVSAKVEERDGDVRGATDRRSHDDNVVLPKLRWGIEIRIHCYYLYLSYNLLIVFYIHPI